MVLVAANKRETMKLKYSVHLIISLAAFQAMAEDQKTAAAPGMSDKEKTSYAVGMYFGRHIKNTGVDADLNVVNEAIKDVIGEKPTRLSEDEFLKEMKAVRAKGLAKLEEQMKKMTAEAEKSKAEGEAFLAKNAKEPGVIVLTNGLQYKVIKQGAGPIPQATDTVTLNYRGTLLDGTEIESSYKTNQPANFSVSDVMAGWMQALEMMRTGSKWRLFIPCDLAYGRIPRPGIPGNSVVIYEIELLGIAPQTRDEILKTRSADYMKREVMNMLARPQIHPHGQTNVIDSK